MSATQKQENMSMNGCLIRVPQSLLDVYLRDSEKLMERVESAKEDPERIDLEKSWPGMYFLLTGNTIEKHEMATSPLSKVLISNPVIDEEQDFGNGPAHYITPDVVQEVNKELQKMTEEDLEKRFDPDRMMELSIFPHIWKQSDALYYVVKHFRELKPFYQLAAEQNQGVISVIR